jgi:cytochrome c-type biogenesis protein CcmH
MLLLTLFALLTALVLAVILRPLLRQAPAAAADDAELDRAVYRDQLLELEREKRHGLIGPPEAEAAEAEIARRLLATEGEEARLAGAGPPLRRGALILTAIAVPLFAAGFYALRGSPALPGLPHAERLANAEANLDMAALIAKVEAHLADHPRDAEGWRVLAPAYRSLGRYDAAARAYAQALAHGKADAGLMADLGEVLVQASDGLVTKAAADSFDAALKLDPGNVKARYFRGLALLQEGRADLALPHWQALLREAPADAPWRALLESQIAEAKLKAIAPELNPQQLSAAETMSHEDRARMIRGMVDGLSARLAQQGGSLEDWLRLARARMVMGEPDKAREVLDRAAGLFAANASAVAQIDALRQRLGSR